MKKFGEFPTKHYEPGEFLIYAGEAPKHLFFLKKGFVKQYANSEEGKELTIHIYEKGSIFPLSWGLNKQAPEHNFVCVGKVEVSIVPLKAFMEIIKKDPGILLGITKRLVAGISGLSHRIEILNFENSQERLFETLLYLRKHFGETINFTHEELAALTGLSRERVSIEMKNLRDKKAISYKRAEIKIHSDYTL